MKVVLEVAVEGAVKTFEDTGSRWVGLLRDEYGERLQGEDGRVYAYRVEQGIWFHNPTKGVVLRFDVFDD